jgi:hypothetical protein
MRSVDFTVASPGVTAEQWRAVSAAIEKFTGQGKYGVHGYRFLPPFHVRWNDPDMPSNAAGLTATFADGTLAVYLRGSLTPERIHEVMLHELFHVFEHRLLEIGVGHKTLDQQAKTRAELLARLPW